MIARSPLACFAALAILAIASSARAADPDPDFYKGKQIRLIVTGGAGAVYDTYARILAEHLPKYIPGNPTIIVQNNPAASGIVATNFLYSAAPRDGTVIVTALSSIPTAPLFSPDAAKFDVTKFSWIGSITSDPFVGYVWHTAPIRTYEEAKSVEATMGGNALGGAGVDMVLLSNRFFGTKFKLITGYKDSVETKLAIERGEVDGTFANAWGDLKTTRYEWIKEGKVRVIVQHGLKKHRELPDVPLFMDQAKTAADRQALEAMLARQEFSKPYFTAPEVPADRVALLRRAFDATLKDPEFLAAAAKARLDVDGPMTGEELAAMVAKVAATPSAVVERIQKVFEEFAAGAK